MIDTVDPVWLVPTEEDGRLTQRGPDDAGMFYVGEWVMLCDSVGADFEFCNYTAPIEGYSGYGYWMCKARKNHEHPHISCVKGSWTDTNAIVQVYRKRKAW